MLPYLLLYYSNFEFIIYTLFIKLININFMAA